LVVVAGLSARFGLFTLEIVGAKYREGGLSGNLVRAGT
jgi:hypothetical protein